MLTEFDIANVSQFYSYEFNASLGSFQCKIAGTVLMTTHPNWIGFSAADYVPVQAEAHQDHLQLGRVSPNWLSFQFAGFRPIGTTGWTSMAINGAHTDDPVWNFSQPSDSHLKVNTDATH